MITCVSKHREDRQSLWAKTRRGRSVAPFERKPSEGYEAQHEEETMPPLSPAVKPSFIYFFCEVT